MSYIMKRILYNSYCYSDVLLNKTKYYLNNNEINTYLETKRIYRNDDSLFYNLYNLTLPSSKLFEKIYLGNAYNSRDYYFLKDNNIGLIVNCTIDIDNYFENDNEFTYHRVPVKDIPGANILEFLEDTVDTINKYLLENNDKKVLVHCFMGSSRSASIISAYMIKYMNFNRRDAIGYIKEKRNIVNINVDFFKQLGDFQSLMKP